MPNRVNLDALIPREYFEAVGAQPSSAQLPPAMRISDFEHGGWMYPFLRKPEFQRETSDWGPVKVAELVRGFLDGDLIPSIILWRSASGNTFVIDGAHRLSAFIAWVNDDYGDREISRVFFNNNLPEGQIKTAEQTRDLIDSQIGSYHNLKRAAMNPSVADPAQLRYAQNLAASAITLQWVIGDATTAERSFFKINQEATPIDPTELTMIKERHQLQALATRALIHAGTGHKYWSAFAPSVQDEIEEIAREIYEVLFRPAMETPIRTLDVPVAGRGYSPDSLKLVFELIKFVNHVPANAGPPDDQDGVKTLEYLKTVRRAASLISGNEPQSLGLHPIVYFYGATGRFQASAFLAVVAFVLELEEKNRLARFTRVRERFEDFLLEHRYLPNQVGRSYGAALRGVPPLLRMYNMILDALDAGEDNNGVFARLNQTFDLKPPMGVVDEQPKRGKSFSQGVKNATFLRQSIDGAVRCSICHARMHSKSISTDHIDAIEEGGTGASSNAQLTHPYCNTGYKESIRARNRGD